MGTHQSIDYNTLFNFIEDFELPKNGQLSRIKGELARIESEFTISDDRFMTSFSTDSRKFREATSNNPSLKKVLFNHNNESLIFDELFINTSSFNINDDLIKFSYTGKVSKLWSDGFRHGTKYYFKLAIPLSTKADFHFKLDYRSRTGLIININNLQFRLKLATQKQPVGVDKYLLVIESLQKSNINVFSKHAFSILVGLGYLTGHFIGDKGYYFAYKSNQSAIHDYFFFSTLRTSMRSSYVPVYANAYAYLHRNHSLANKTNKTLKPVSKDEFSKLCQAIDSSIDFASILLMVIESSAASLFPMAGGYAIALESLSDLILSDIPQESRAPIKDKCLAKKLRKELKLVLDKMCPDLDDDSRKPIIARLDNINSKTNMDNLKAPFELLGITLSDEDINIIKTRNDLLHGRIPTVVADKSVDTQDDNKVLFYTASRLYTLINLLILKRIGFTSKIVNYPKIYQRYTKIKLNEKHFRQV